MTGPVQGPAGAPFRPGDRFRWRSGNGLTVRTGTILEFQGQISDRFERMYGWGSWFVQVDPLPAPAPGASPEAQSVGWVPDVGGCGHAGTCDIGSPGLAGRSGSGG